MVMAGQAKSLYTGKAKSGIASSFAGTKSTYLTMAGQAKSTYIGK